MSCFKVDYELMPGYEHILLKIKGNMEDEVTTQFLKETNNSRICINSRNLSKRLGMLKGR
jgi:hypothetical protein